MFMWQHSCNNLLYLQLPLIILLKFSLSLICIMPTSDRCYNALMMMKMMILFTLCLLSTPLLRYLPESFMAKAFLFSYCVQDLCIVSSSLVMDKSHFAIIEHNDLFNLNYKTDVYFIESYKQVILICKIVPFFFDLCLPIFRGQRSFF